MLQLLLLEVIYIYLWIIDILRKYPQSIKDIGSVLAASIDFVSESESKSSLIWILGEFGSQIEDAPYLMENFINNDEIQA